MAHEEKHGDDAVRRGWNQEQYSECLKEIARNAGTYFQECQRQGFKRDEAMRLTLAMQTEQFRGLYSRPSSKPEP